MAGMFERLAAWKLEGADFRVGDELVLKDPSRDFYSEGQAKAGRFVVIEAPKDGTVLLAYEREGPAEHRWHEMKTYAPAKAFRRAT